MRVEPTGELSGRQIHVWTFRVGAASDVRGRCEQVLSPDEHSRAARMRFQHPRDSFIGTRGALRHLLGRYLELDPASIRFAYGPNGKPELAQDCGVRFNVAHSGPVAVFAFTMGCEIGVDLEQLRPLPDLEEIARRYFCAEEAAEIDSLPPGERELAFFTCWTRKEAYIKASGAGLARPLSSFRVASVPGEPGTLSLRDQEATGSWSLHDLALAPGCAAAIAYRDHPRPLSIIPVADLAQFFDLS